MVQLQAWTCMGEYPCELVGEIPAQVDDPVLTSGEASQNILDRSLFKERLSMLEDEMQRLCDFHANCYRLYHQVTPPREVPFQYLAFDQLRLRFLKGQAIFASILAPTGYGKRELFSAWLHFTASHGSQYAVCEVTGVAATQLSGCTIHNLLSLRADGSTNIECHPERRRYLEEVQGSIIDEAMMAEYVLGNNFTEELRQIPLDSSVKHAY